MMEDREIIQTLELCSSSKCDDCYYCNTGIPCLNLYRQARDLINRQQAKIEELEMLTNIYSKQLTDAWSRIEELDKLNETAKNKAIKEFVVILGKRFEHNGELSLEAYHSVMGSMEELAASMTGEVW